jgi:hypothetical protein
MATLDDLRGLGYGVGLSFEGDGFAVYRVEGFGLSMPVRDDDEEALQRILDAHDEAVQQQGENVHEMQLRWHEDPENPFELPDDHAVQEAREQARLARAAE